MHVTPPSQRRHDLTTRLRDAGSVFPDEELAAFIHAARGQEELDDMVRRRCGGEPVQYITGQANFADLVLHIVPGVFIPRYRTTWLARLAARRTPKGGRLLDLACGCGPIAAYVISEVPDVAVTACDVDPLAVECARANLPSSAVVLVSSFFDAVPAQSVCSFDVIAANLPYVPAVQVGLLPRESRDHEPAHSLRGGRDGLDPLRDVAAQLTGWLKPDGAFLVEVAKNQVDEAGRVLRAQGLDRVRVHAHKGFDAHVVEAR